MKAGPAAKLDTTRRMLGAIFLFGSLGTSAELMLMGHTEGVWQHLPLILITIGCGTLGLVARKRGITQLRAFQLVLILFVVSGVPASCCTTTATLNSNWSSIPSCPESRSSPNQ